MIYLMPILSWISKNKLASILLVIVVFLLLRSVSGSTKGMPMVLEAPASMLAKSVSLSSEGFDAGQGMGSNMMMPGREYTPQPDVTNRMVIENSSVSLLVKSVMEVKDKIIAYAEGNGGYMVNSQVSNPQDAPSATVTVRVQSAKLKEALDYLHSLAVKVVSENLTGTDVTDQYVDIAKRIALLETTKAKFEAILASAKEISDITNVTQQILNYQNQIDSLKGSQLALEKNAQLAKITVYISTDEIALPYAPSETFRPGVIFKLAVRSLVGTLRRVATIAIWVGVYALVVVPIILIVWAIKKYFPRKPHISG